MLIRSGEGHIYSFDLTRGIAAVAVVLLHWGEFARPDLGLPLVSSLAMFYRFGAFSVPLFFVLSGFIFTWLYADPIKTYSVGIKEFAILRMTRLYPLFILTFAVVAVELKFSNMLVGYNFRNLYSDGYHAFLSVLMLTGWGFERGFSFNAPSWSVSTEVFLYGVFFLATRFCRIGLQTALAMMVIGVALTPLSVHIAGGMAQFFAGVATYHAFQSWKQRQGLGPVILSILFMIIILAVYLVEYFYGPGLSALRLAMPGVAKLEIRYQIVRDLVFATLFFPLLVFAQAALELRIGSGLFRRQPAVQWLGNISYALYLWHFPLMILSVIVCQVVGASLLIFYQPGSLVLYMIVLLGLSHVSFYFFERPVMLALRHRLLPRRPSIIQRHVSA